ncbi:hypothetical protein JOM56_012754 [Amanita muscaria]
MAFLSSTAWLCLMRLRRRQVATPFSLCITTSKALPQISYTDLACSSRSQCQKNMVLQECTATSLLSYRLSQSFIMNLANQFSALKINAPLPRNLNYSSWGYRVDPIEYVTDTENVSDDRVKANQTFKRTWMISAKKSRVYYVSSGEDSNSEDSDSTDSECVSDSEIAIEQDDDSEWITCVRRRAELSAARAAARAAAAAASAIVN